MTKKYIKPRDFFQSVAFVEKHTAIKENIRCLMWRVSLRYVCEKDVTTTQI